MKNFIILLVLLSIQCIGKTQNTRDTLLLKENWKFLKADMEEAIQFNFDDQNWQEITVPHDWAIYGPFDKEIDKQSVAIIQNGEEIATEKTGRTGALPYTGVGWYRNKFLIPESLKDKKVLLVFEGAMSEPQVYLNEKKVGEWKYGYSYFYFDISDDIMVGKENLLSVRLQNRERSSRWYPGAGLYRKVYLIFKDKTHFNQWGTFITSPIVTKDSASILIKSETYSKKGDVVHINILNSSGKTINKTKEIVGQNGMINTGIIIKNPELWSPESPELYQAQLKLYSNNELKDDITIKFGIRDIKYIPHEGFFLNGEKRKFKGVCLHHDLGPLGTAVNKSALRRQLKILKEMGANAVRSAHNMPAIEQVELCDEMGLMFLAESFDEWAVPKVDSGYHLFFEEYAEKDIVNLVRALRNHPSIVMWSAGNEVPDQWGEKGVERARFLQDIFHREDPTRPVTVGMDQVKATMESGFGAVLDVPGLNYRVHLYDEAYQTFPQGFILGSETASTVSSRGVYKFPVKKASMKKYSDFQCSSYDLEYCSWSNLPEDDFILQDDKEWVIGEFVWTGFDYLGEPTPYDEAWPSRSSYFGICDLAGLPKDRYYLYQSRWNEKKETLHILPHWTWPEKEGDTIPIFVYTSYPKAELWINGKSQGIQEKSNKSPQNRYRLMWMNTIYQAGEIKVIAYDENNHPSQEKIIKTAGDPYQIILHSDRTILKANGEDMAFITVSIQDINGLPCPTTSSELNIDVNGSAEFRSVCNGDPTSLELFHIPKMKLFNGKMVISIISKDIEGEAYITVSGNKIISGKLKIITEK